MSYKKSAIAALVLCLALVGIYAPSAQATTPTLAPEWSSALGDISPRTLQTSPDGSVSGSTCDYSATSLVTVSQADGTRTTDMPATKDDSSSRCIIEQAVDRDGIVYTIETPTLDGRYGDYANAYVAAYKDDQQLWTSDFGTCQGGSPSWPVSVKIVPQSLRVGHDGGVYTLTSRSGWDNCTDGRTDQLVKLDKSNGATRFAVPLTGVGTDGSWLSMRMTPYRDGLAVADGTRLRYFSYDGIESTTRGMTYTEGVINHTVGYNGEAYLTPVWSGNQCADISYSPSIQPASVATWTVDECNGDIVTMRSMPNGLLARQYWDGYQQSGNYNLKVYSSDGTPVFKRVLTANGESTSYQNTRLSYDDTGNTLITQVEPSGKLSLELVGPTGSTQSLVEADGVTISSGRLGPVAVSDGSAYVVVCNVSCSYSQGYNGSVLYKFNLTGLGSEYLRGKLVDDDAPWKQYVALGDSFSSGESSAPFEPATDINGTNECHRSVTDAYPRFLMNHSSANVGLVNFVACSGATTDNVWGYQTPGTQEGLWNEQPQINSLTNDTDVVTLTIGGNDVDFKGFATNCVLFSCAPGSSTYVDTMDRIQNDLPTSLNELYRIILGKAPNAKLYVLGYPQMIDLSNATCWTSANNAQGAYNVTAELNDTIQDAVGVIQSDTTRPQNQNRIEYVNVNSTSSIISAFAGHELCTSEPYFNQYIPDNKEYSFHPNALGQAAYMVQLGLVID